MQEINWNLQDTEHWDKVVQDYLSRPDNDDDYIYNLSMLLSERMEYYSDRWCKERLYVFDQLWSALKQKLIDNGVMED